MRRTGRHVARVREPGRGSPRCARCSRRSRFLGAERVAPAAVAPTIAMSAPAEAAPAGHRTTSSAPAVVPPTQVVQVPASLTRAGARLSTQQRSRAVLAAAAPTSPSPALAAYQRAATVIDASDPGCHISWEHIAAIGRIESDHGRYGGSHLDRNGVALPGILGIALDGTHGTRRIRDTDAGLYDGDTRWDRAVGPMQFIPSTWSVVGVDADGDGSATPRTSTTRPWPPRSTSAPATTTSSTDAGPGRRDAALQPQQRVRRAGAGHRRRLHPRPLRRGHRARDPLRPTPPTPSRCGCPRCPGPPAPPGATPATTG